MMKKLKINDVAKDLHLTTQELIAFYETRSSDGQKKKSGSSLTPEEVNLALEYFTQQHQVSNFDAYFASRNTPRPAPEPAQKEKPVKKEKSVKQEKPANSSNGKQEAKPAQKPVQQQSVAAPKQEAKPAQKPEAKSVQKPETKPAPKQEAKPAPKQEAKSAPKQKEQPAVQPKQSKPEASKPQAAAPEQKTVTEKDPMAETKKKAPEQKAAEKTEQRNKKPQKQTPKAQKHGERLHVEVTMASADSVKTEKRRTVDTRGSYVDLDKYNQRYEQIAPANKYKDNYSTKKQKINQKSAQRNKQKYSNKRETEQDKLRRLELERARKQQLKVLIPDNIVVSELASRLKVTATEVIKKLMMLGVMATINQEIDFDTASLVAEELGAKVEKEVIVTIEERLIDEEDTAEDTQERSPVVVVMGHVDHGKTSLLDAIRQTNVIDREAGGITQHIGASVVEVNGEKITFLDTPGHEAFTAMRMRGASSTDIAILVVAADDGVMPQTVEAINHAKAAGVEIIVAVNKIDKPSANVDRVKQELTEYELIAEDWGGSTIFVPVSAKTGEGLDELMEMILLTAEVMELKANPNRRARGLVLEAQLDKGRGPVATVLVQKGTLRVGDAIAAGSAHGKVRAMMDDKGRRVKEAGPSVPVEILGLDDVPNAGEVVVCCKNEKEARSFAETFIAQNKVKLLEDTKSKLSLDDLFTQIQEGNLKELDLIVKADVQGSVEAVKQSLLKLSNDEVIVKVIHGGVGAINESDVSLASASNAIIIGFNVRPDATAKETAEREGVDVRLYRVIYNAIEDVEAAMKGMLDPVFEEKVLGHAEVRQTFKASGVGTIAGSYVLDGLFERDCSVRLTRDGIVIFEGPLASLKRFKDDVKEVKAGYECGFVFANFNDIKEGDLVEAFKMVEVPR